MGKAPDTWALVTDGGRARIVALKRHPAEFEEIVEWTSPTRHRSSRSLESDASGRSHNVKGPGTHVREPRSNARDQEEQRFIEKLLERLAQAQGAGEFGSLVLVADPRSLGRIRDQISNGLRQRVVLELNLDLTKLDSRDLQNRLREALGWPPAKKAGPG